MKLHLPKLLRHAVLTCMASVAGVAGFHVQASSIDISTAPEYNGSEGGSYAGIVFTLSSADTERFTITGGELTATVTLNSLALTERGNNNLAADRILYVTDSNNVYLGSSSVFTKAEGTDVAVFDFGGAITLNVADTYYAYLMDSAGDDSWTVGETVVPSGQFYSGQLAAAGGSLTAGNAANWGLLNGQKSQASAGFAPVMEISVTTSASPTPPPAEDTNRIYWEGSSTNPTSWDSDNWANEDGVAGVADLRPMADNVVVFSDEAGTGRHITVDTPQTFAGAEFSGGTYSITGGSESHLQCTGTVNLLNGADVTLEVGLTAAGVSMAGGTSLTLNKAIDLGESGKIAIKGAGAAISLGEAVSLTSAQLDTSAGGATVVLSGAGTYTVEGSSATLGGVSCHETDWTGTVNLVGVALNKTNTVLNRAGNANSTVVLSNCTGYVIVGTVAANIVLNGESGQPAMLFNDGSSSGTEDYVATRFQGSISGSGDAIFTKTFTRAYTGYEFQGDVSGWDGSFEMQGGNTFNLVFSGAANEINANVGKTNGALVLQLGADSATTVNGTISVDAIKVNNSQKVTFTQTVDTKTLTATDAEVEYTGALTLLSGESSVRTLVSTGGLTLGTAAADSAAAVDATLVVTDALTLSGTLTLNSAGSSISAGSLVSSGFNVAAAIDESFTSQTILSLETAAGDMALTLNGKSNGVLSADGNTIYELQWDADRKVLSLVASEAESYSVGGDVSWSDPDAWTKKEVPEELALFKLAMNSSVTLGTGAQTGTLEVNTNADDTTVANVTTLKDGTLSTDEIVIKSGKLVIDSSAEVSTGKLMSASPTMARLSSACSGILAGKVTVTGTGGSYAGGYEDAEVEIAGGSQTLAPAAGLTVSGSSGTATLAYGADAGMDAICTDGATVVLERSNGAALELLEASTMKGGSLEIQLTADELAGGTATLLKGETLTLDGTTLVISTGIDADSKVLESTPDTLGQATIESIGELQVEFDSAAFSKYYTGVEADGKVLRLIRNTSYYSDKAGASVSANGAAGLAMADAAMVALNPQAAAPAGGLAAVLDAMDTATGAAADELGASLAGASTAVLGMATMGDVDRQLQAIRNRTTTMGVDQSVAHENMPYLNAWINAEGDRSELSESGTESGYELSSWGGTVGFDADFCPTFTAGMALTAMYGDIDTTGADKASGNIDTYYVTAFARYASSAWTHTFVATVGKSDISLDRHVAGAEVEGETDGLSFGLMYEVGRVFALNEDGTACLQPVFNVAWKHTTVDAYTEDGGDLALEVDEQTLDTVTFGLGARLQAVVGESIYNRTSILEARVLAKADVGDRSGSSDVALAALPEANGSVDSAEMGAFGLEAGAGLSIPVGQEGGSIFMDASVELRSDYTNVNGTVGYRVNF